MSNVFIRAMPATGEGAFPNSVAFCIGMIDRASAKRDGRQLILKNPTAHVDLYQASRKPLDVFFSQPVDKPF